MANVSSFISVITVMTMPERRSGRRQMVATMPNRRLHWPPLDTRRTA